ncbi:MAG: lipoyl synthase [Candidatus Omnitrophota bacterium]
MSSRLPPWFRQEIPDPALMFSRKRFFRSLGLHTVCESCRCPNIFDCFKRDTATFMILGGVCTRECSFCATEKGLPFGEAGAPAPLNEDEPQALVCAVRQLGLKYVVITSVTRDDLPDGGAKQFALTVTALKESLAGLKIEVLIPDFQGDSSSLRKVVDSGPEVINHNLETIARLYPKARPQANYQRSLELLRMVKQLNPALKTKSGLMVGLGEEFAEVVAALRDLRGADCDILTIGQYLAPSEKHFPVQRFVPQEDFAKWQTLAGEMGFKQAFCAPLARSSFHAEEVFSAARSDAVRLSYAQCGLWGWVVRSVSGCGDEL